MLGDSDGNVRLEAENTQVTESDCTGHAELNLMREASRRFDSGTLTRCTVYAPCQMCAGAIYWGGARRAVYALSLHPMADLAGKAADEINVDYADVLAHGTRAVEVAGPTLEDEARHVFHGPVRR